MFLFPLVAMHCPAAWSSASLCSPCCAPESCEDVLEDPCSFPRRGRPALGTWLPRKGRAGRVPERWVSEGVIQSGVAVRHPEQAPLPPLLEPSLHRSVHNLSSVRKEERDSVRRPMGSKRQNMGWCWASA